MISDEKKNLRKALNHLERISRNAREIVEKPMSLNKLAEELNHLAKTATLAHGRIIKVFMENTDIFERMELGNEYGEL